MSGARLLVTGAAGFIACRLAEQLMREGNQVIGVDDFSRNQAPRRWMALPWRETIDRETFWEGMESMLSGVDAVFHLGARTDTMATDKELIQHLNLEYSQRLWAACTKLGIPLLYASSAAVYGDGSLGYSDDPELISQLRPLNLYGQSKLDFDVWVQEQSQRPPFYAGFRFFNVYGPGEGHKGRMASVMWHGYKQILQTGEIQLFASDKEGIAHGEQKRDFIYVDDVVDCLIRQWKSPGASGIYNLGTGRARSFNDLARSLFAAMRAKEHILYIPMPAKLQGKYQYFTQADPQNLRSKAGYTAPFTPLETGVARYVDWLKTGG